MAAAAPPESPDSKLPRSTLKIAVEGCGHGALDEIYSTIERKCEARGWLMDDLDLLIICGDFQAVRNKLDLNCMSVPRKYRQLGDFHEYYSGAKQAPVLTLVIGGNHEASNHFFELYHGGWLAPNIYYLGAANVLRYGPYRIAGLSGIYYAPHYREPHFERLPYGRDEVRSIYHVREYDTNKLLHVRGPIDIGLSHDWPRGIDWFGDYKKLFAQRPHFLESAKVDRLGSLPAQRILHSLKPNYWFSGHMHVKYTATVEHNGGTLGKMFDGLTIDPDMKAQIPKTLFQEIPSTVKGKGKNNAKPKPSKPATAISNALTHFLALSKPGPKSEFLELVEIESHSDSDCADHYLQTTAEGKYMLQYDEEWLAITRAFDEGLILGGRLNKSREKSATSSANALPKHLDWVKQNITAKGLLRIPDNFERHAPICDPDEKVSESEQPLEFPNSQTEQFYKLLEIPNRFTTDEEVEDDGLVVFG